MTPGDLQDQIEKKGGDEAAPDGGTQRIRIVNDRRYVDSAAYGVFWQLVAQGVFPPDPEMADDFVAHAERFSESGPGASSRGHDVDGAISELYRLLSYYSDSPDAGLGLDQPGGEHPWVKQTWQEHRDRIDVSALQTRLDKAQHFADNLVPNFLSEYDKVFIQPLTDKITNQAVYGLTDEDVAELQVLRDELENGNFLRRISSDYHDYITENFPDDFSATTDAELNRIYTQYVSPAAYILQNSDGIIERAVGFAPPEGSVTTYTAGTFHRVALQSKQVGERKAQASADTAQHALLMERALEKAYIQARNDAANNPELGERATAMGLLYGRVQGIDWAAEAAKVAGDAQYLGIDGSFNYEMFVSAKLNEDTSGNGIGFVDEVVQNYFPGAVVWSDKFSGTLDSLNRTQTPSEKRAVDHETQVAQAEAEQIANEQADLERAQSLDMAKGDRWDQALFKIVSAYRGEAALARHEGDQEYANKIDAFADRLESGNLGTGEGTDYKGLKDMFLESAQEDPEAYLTSILDNPNYDNPIEESVEELLAEDRLRQVSAAQFTSFLSTEAERLEAESARVAQSNPEQSLALASQAQEIRANAGEMAQNFATSGGVGPTAMSRFYNREVLSQDNQELDFTNPFLAGGALPEDAISQAQRFVGAGFNTDAEGNILSSNLDPNTGAFRPPSEQVGSDQSRAAFNQYQPLIASGYGIQQALFDEFVNTDIPLDDARNETARGFVNQAIGQLRPEAVGAGEYDYAAVRSTALDLRARHNAEVQNAHNAFLGEVAASQAQAARRQQQQAQRQRQEGTTTALRRRQNRP